MRLLNCTPAGIFPAVLLLVLGPVLMSCAVQPTAAHNRALSGSANPIGVQTGRLTVIAIDYADGGPLSRATVDIVASNASLLEPVYYRRSALTDRFGRVTFNDVPQVVDVLVQHARGVFGVDNYLVPQSGSSEFRAYIETTGPRARDE